MPQDTGFDAFFKAVTTSPEFRTAATKDWKGDAKATLEASLKEMEKGVAGAWDLMKSFEETFATPEAFSAGNAYEPNVGNSGSGGSNGPASSGSGNGGSKDGDAPSSNVIEVKRFKMKNPDTFGFKGIAGMDDLKTELQESFIAPLKFKFLIERLAAEVENAASVENSAGVDGGGNKPAPSEKDAKKAELYKKLYAEYEKFKVSIPTGLLFYGPPGTGKTYITKKLAEELHAGFIEKSLGEFGSSYQHETTKNIRAFFAAAKEASELEPTILFLDEIDSLLSKRTDNVDARKAEEISQFLQEFNGLQSAKNLIVIAATNRPDHLDSAILRSGRLDKKFYIGPPDFAGRREMFRLYLEKEGRPHGKLDYEKLAELTENYVASDIEAICDEVARDASQSILSLATSLESEETDLDAVEKGLKKNVITMKTLKKAILEMPSSLKAVDMSVYEKWLEKTS